MDKVKQFGRLGKFDFLTTIAKLNLAPITPGKAYFYGATGPSVGANLLFTGNKSGTLNHRQLENKVAKLAAFFGHPFIMQIIEDSLCNWQKSPSQYVQFK